MEALVSLHTIRNDDEYNRAVAELAHLLDSGAGGEQHPLAELVSILGELIAEYDDVHYVNPPVPSSAILNFLMEQHDLTKAQLPEIGNADIVGQVLDGSRDLSADQVTALSQRFKLPETIFRT
jgi:HTH-type transcriptional regulator/antitoxin HigA